MSGLWCNALMKPLRGGHWASPICASRGTSQDVLHGIYTCSREEHGKESPICVSRTAGYCATMTYDRALVGGQQHVLQLRGVANTRL